PTPSLNVSAAAQVSAPYSGLGSNGLGLTSARATNSSCMSTNSSIARLAASRPSATTCSVGVVPLACSRAQVLSGASPSIIRMSTCPESLRRPATTMSNVASSRSWNVGLMTHSPPISPSRTEPTGPSNAIPDSIVAGAVPEARSHGAVGEARRQDRGFGRATLAAEEPTGDLARGVHPLLDVDREREEIDPLAGLSSGAGGEDLRLAVRHDARAARLQGELARLERQRAVPE